MGTCLGDEFSVNWMEDSESSNPFSETLDQQYKLVKSKTLGSPVQKFGDFDFVSEPIANFEGGKDADGVSFIEATMSQIKNSYTQFVGEQFGKVKNLVDSRDVMMHYLYTRVQRNGDNEAHQQLIDEIQHRMNEESVFLNVFPHH